MEKIFYTEKYAFPTSISAVEKILNEYFGVYNVKINRTDNGKPYLENSSKRLFFSVSHTKTTLFIAFSDENVGIDAESLDRKVDYVSILKKFPIEEREEIRSTEIFLRHWTVRESAVKWLGGTLARELGKFSYVKGKLCYRQKELSVCVTTIVFQNHILSICSERDFSNAEFILL